jgi:HEAT repeats
MPQLRCQVLCFAALLALLSGTDTPVWGQVAKKQPAGKKSARKKKKAVPKPPAPGIKTPAPETSPLLVEPTNPEELFRATSLMYRLARPNLARKYLQQLLDSKPDEKTLLQLRDRHGPAIFLRLAGAKELQPLSQQLLKQVNAAFRKRGADPKYINGLLDNLEGTAAQRDVAITSLRNLGPVVVPRIVDRIAASNNPDRVTTMQEALLDFGAAAVAPLIAALDANVPRVQAAAMTTLGRIGDRDAVPYLWHFAFDSRANAATRANAQEALARILKTSAADLQKLAPASVSQELARRALAHFRGEYRWKTGPDKRVELWTWQPTANPPTLATQRVAPRLASLYVGARFARQALELSPENRKLQALYLAMSLSAAADPTWEKSLPKGKGTAYETALAAGAAVVKDALTLSLKSNDATAAVALLLVLRQLATRDDLKGGTDGSPIVAAMNYPDPRVQFVAATTVLNIDPDKSFRGITRVVAILARSLNSDGAAAGLVVNASVQQGASLAGILGQLGYEPQLARTGRDGFRLAATRGDIELILLQANTIRWPLSQTLANLRADSRTANIPIVIYGPADRPARVASHLRRYPMVTYITEVTRRDTLAIQLDPFLAAIKSPPLSPKQRAEQRSAAAFWLNRIASGKRSHIYDLRPAESALIGAVTDPKLTEDVLPALAAIASKNSQQTLQMMTVNVTADVKFRRLAATLLATHIQRYGLLLSNTQVAALRKLRATATDAELATAMAAVIGTLKPDRQLSGKRVQSIPLPKLP